jgi:hypothetical protein
MFSSGSLPPLIFVLLAVSLFFWITSWVLAGLSVAEPAARTIRVIAVVVAAVFAVIVLVSFIGHPLLR